MTTYLAATLAAREAELAAHGHLASCLEIATWVAVENMAEAGQDCTMTEAAAIGRAYLDDGVMSCDCAADVAWLRSRVDGAS